MPSSPVTPSPDLGPNPGALAALAAADTLISPPVQPPFAMPDAAKDRLDFLWKVHGYTNDYIRFADTKAGVIAGSVVAVMGALVASHPFDAVAKTPLAQQHYRVWFSASALVLLVSSFVFALLAIRPRLRSTVPKGFIFWSSVAEHESDLSYADACKKLSADEMELNVSRHIYALAAICKRKYFWTNLSLLTGSVGGLLAAAIVLAIHILQQP